jgi:hypothetical protein
VGNFTVYFVKSKNIPGPSTSAAEIFFAGIFVDPETASYSCFGIVCESATLCLNLNCLCRLCLNCLCFRLSRSAAVSAGGAACHRRAKCVVAGSGSAAAVCMLDRDH